MPYALVLLHSVVETHIAEFELELGHMSQCVTVLRTAPRDCMTEPETGCSGSISCTRGSIPRISCMHPVGLFQRIFGEYSTSPLQSLLVPHLQSPSSDGETTVPSLLMERQADEQEPLSTWESRSTNDETIVPCWNILQTKMPRQ